MNSDARHGGVIHTYQRYDPLRLPSPLTPPPDVASVAMEHLLYYGSLRHLTDEELARAVPLDPSQIAGLGPGIDALIEMLLQRKARILATWETDTVQQRAGRRYHDAAAALDPPLHLRRRFRRAVAAEQLADLERLWYRTDEKGPFALGLLRLIEYLGEKYQIDELAARYTFTGRRPLTIPQALEIREELLAIDRLLEQLRRARETAAIGIIDMDELARFAEPGQLDDLRDLQRRIYEYLRQLAEMQGLEPRDGRYTLTPRALRLFQSRILEQIFADLQPARSGRHRGPVTGEGAIETQRAKPYEFGDSLVHMDVPATVLNALIREPAARPPRIRPDDIEILRTRNTPKCATTVLLDMSGSMRWNARYVDTKRMALGLHGLIKSEFPGDFLQFIEVATFARARRPAEIPELMPRPVTVFDPVVRLRVDMSDPDTHEFQVPPHFTNIQHGLALARRMLAAQDTPNRQIILITDGLPTAHFEGEMLYLLYPPHPRTEEATMREARAAAREGITINIFLLPHWSQTREDVVFAHRLAESARGRVFFTGGRDLDRYVVWDYVRRRRSIIG